MKRRCKYVQIAQSGGGEGRSVFAGTVPLAVHHVAFLTGLPICALVPGERIHP